MGGFDQGERPSARQLSKDRHVQCDLVLTLMGDSLLLPGTRSEPLSMNIAGQAILFLFPGFDQRYSFMQPAATDDAFCPVQ